MHLRGPANAAFLAAPQSANCETCHAILFALQMLALNFLILSVLLETENGNYTVRA